MANLGLLNFTEALKPYLDPPEIIKEDDKYYAAIGRFIVAYASAESTIHQIARKLSRLKENRARILFGGMRIGDITTRMRALLKISNRSIKVQN